MRGAPDVRELVGRRIGAGLLDLLALMPLFALLAAVIGSAEIGDGGLSFELEGFAFLAFIGLSLLYYLAMEARFGQTLGKRALGLRVAADDGSPPSSGSVLVRTMMRIVDFLPFLYLLGLVVVVGRRGKRLGDLLAGTVVGRAATAVEPEGESKAARAQASARSFAAAYVALLALTAAVAGVGALLEKGSPADDLGTFEREGFPFTFEYPAGFEFTDDVSAGATTGTAAIDAVAVAVDEDNGIFLQRFALPVEIDATNLRLAESEASRLIARTDPSAVPGELAEIGGFPGVVYRTVELTAPANGQSLVAFLFQGDQEYVLSCQSTPVHRAQVENACETALGSLTRKGA